MKTLLFGDSIFTFMSQNQEVKIIERLKEESLPIQGEL